MSLSMSIAAVILGSSSFAAPEVSYFPGSYFEARAKATLQRRAMERWPGSSQIVGRWRSGDLKHPEKMAILLGASASHDPILLPLYREAVTSANDRMRMAAAYGYRDLLGDGLPDVTGGVELADAELLAREMDMVARTLRERPLVEFWLQGALMSDGASMPGWRGLVFNRAQGICFRAVEKILIFDDVSYLATAYRHAVRKRTKISLMRLLEAVALQKFFTKPNNPQAGWGSKDMDDALAAADAFVDYWIDVRCTTDPDLILSSSLKTMGVSDVQPLAPSSYDVWLRVLKHGAVAWHMMAARQLYNLGGRWSQLSSLQAEAQPQIKARDELILWYRLLPAHILNRREPKPASQP